jgi:hypothetical protein
MTTISSDREYAIIDPSGDHAGVKLCPPSVKRVRLPDPTSRTKRSV